VPRPQAAKLVWSPAARTDLVWLREFIALHNPDAARRAAQSLKKSANLIAEHPGIGTRLESRQDREIFVPFGARGYIIRYRYDGKMVVILRIWHSLEDR